MNSWWLLPTVAIVSMWLGAAIALFILTILAAGADRTEQDRP
jgi:hypothetical protein